MGVVRWRFSLRTGGVPEKSPASGGLSGKGAYLRPPITTHTVLCQSSHKVFVMTKRVKIVTVNDKMQRGYTYILTAPAGRNFDPEFCPELTPKEMLALGVFGGKYMTDCRNEFPASWFARAKLSPSGSDPALNYFGVGASQPLSVWRDKGWLHPDDPRGWFQWYCRYYMGRRMTTEDARQIKRWKAIRRHIAQIRRHCEPGDPMCRPRQRQALLHWAYDSRKL
jgi:hypothetical protein